ncbi:MAG: ABC transporter permease subunit [Eubacterium sp.]|nr:ABC transporter permease subunit [Eubacterium sp.]
MSAEVYKKKKSLYARAKSNKKAQAAGTIIFPAILGAVIFILWQSQGLHKILNTDLFILPLPTKIISLIGSNFADIMVNVKTTLIEVIGGLVFGCLLGYLVAIAAASKPNIGKGGLAVLGAFASVPVVALAPVMNNWTKDVSNEAEVRSMVAKIIVIALITGANMCLNSYRGLVNLPPYAEDLMATYAAKKKWVLLKLRIPNSLPYVFVALKIAVPSAIMTAIVSEYFAEYISGVGREIRENIVLAQYTTAWAYIMVACVIGVGAYILLMVLSKAVLKNYPKQG